MSRCGEDRSDLIILLGAVEHPSSSASEWRLCRWRLGLIRLRGVNAVRTGHVVGFDRSIPRGLIGSCTWALLHRLMNGHRCRVGEVEARERRLVGIVWQLETSARGMADAVRPGTCG